MVKKCVSCGTPPPPYYVNPKNSTTQDHAAIFRDTQYAAGLSIKEEFVIPALGTDIPVKIDNLINVVAGSYLWNPAYGYLKIVHWDSCTNIVGLLNEDISGAAIPGTVVSEYSLWAVTARPCCADQDTFSLFPFLAEDYQIPGVGNSVTLQVTSTFGLIEGTNIRIGSNVYFLDQINSSLEIVVTNEGAGGTPGDTVSARDVNGDLQYLITQAVASACSSSGNDTVRLIGCNGATEAILTGEWAGQVPVLIDPTTEEASYFLLDTSIRTCTSLTVAKNILTATPSYTIQVGDESIFSIGQIIQLDNGVLRWEITDNTTPNELDITCTTGNPGSNFTIPAGSSVCLQLTSDDVDELEVEVTALTSTVATLEVEVETGWIDAPGVCTYLSASSFEIVGDYSAVFKVGQKIKLQLNGVDFYANINDVTYNGVTPGSTFVGIITNLDYILANTGITNLQYSLSNPADFPPYFNYDPQALGFSSFTAELGMYWVVESELQGIARISGASNTTNFTIQIPTPYDTTIGYTTLGTATDIVDNTAVDAVGSAVISGTTLSIYKGQVASSWVNINNKGAVIKYSYILAQP